MIYRSCIHAFRLPRYMSNRGRQVVASFLIHDFGLPDWRIGAEYLESKLIDYDACSNWGNWQYLAGVGNDPRGLRRFNVYKQAKQYDPSAYFIAKWCPELRNIPVPEIFAPHILSKEEQELYRVRLVDAASLCQEPVAYTTTSVPSSESDEGEHHKTPVYGYPEPVVSVKSYLRGANLSRGS